MCQKFYSHETFGLIDIERMIPEGGPAFKLKLRMQKIYIYRRGLCPASEYCAAILQGM